MKHRYSTVLWSDFEHGSSSAVASVSFDRGSDGTMEDKRGVLAYDGCASTYHEWESRAQMKVAQVTKPEEYRDRMTKILEGLRGQAHTTVRTIMQKGRY